MARRKKRKTNYKKIIILLISSVSITLFSFSLWDLIKTFFDDPLVTLMLTSFILIILVTAGFVTRNQLKEILL